MIEAAPAVPVRAAAGGRAVMVVVVLATFMAFLDATIVNVAFPAIQGSFPGTSRPDLSWVLNAYNIVFAALLVPAGRVADLVGRRRVFLVGVALFAVASVGCAAAPAAAWLVTARLVQAVGAAMIMPSALALLLPTFPPDRKASAVALGGAAAGIAAALGPSLGGLIVHAASWRVIFLINVPLGAWIWARGSRVLHESRDASARSLPDLLGTLLLMLAIGLLALGLVEGPDWGWSSARVVASLACGMGLLPVFVLRCRGRLSPALDLEVLRHRRIRAANLATLVFAAGFFAKILCDVLFLTSVWHYSVLKAGLAMSPSPLITAATAGVAGRLAERIGHRRVIVAGALMYALACAWYAAVIPLRQDYVSAFLPATVLTGIGIAAALPMLTSAAIGTLDDGSLGAGGAVNATFRQLGGVLGVAILIGIVSKATPLTALGKFHGGWLFIAIAAGVAAVIASAIGADPAHAGAPDAGEARAAPRVAVSRQQVGG